jgi:hypothetical protein
MRSALTVKIVSGLALLLPGVWLVTQHGAVGGAWFMNALFLLSIALTAAITLPHLRRAGVDISKPMS